MRLELGDCVEVLAGMDPDSIDACVTDPPYGLEFMGKEWDRLDAGLPQENVWKGRRPDPEFVLEYRQEAPSSSVRAQRWHEAWAREVYRVLKPGAHLLAFGGTRTYHRLACAIEDAGFEIRDTIAWVYGSGFPKSLDVSKAIDKAAGAEREVLGERVYGDGKGRPNQWSAAGSNQGWKREAHKDYTGPRVVERPATEQAQRWNGWGTALKPAYEPVVVARKPLTGTVAANVVEHGTGALNIDGCRIETDEVIENHGRASTSNGWDPRMSGEQPKGQTPGQALGRWPANLVLDAEAGAMLDEQAGERSAGRFPGRVPRADGIHGGGQRLAGDRDPLNLDSGGASRFFYCPKPDREERNLGGKNTHPTVKPIALMSWLCRLVTPPGGTVLDPFLGSGTTGIAAAREGFDFVGIEREAEYLEIARARIIGDAPLFYSTDETSI